MTALQTMLTECPDCSAKWCIARNKCSAACEAYVRAMEAVAIARRLQEAQREMPYVDWFNVDQFGNTQTHRYTHVAAQDIVMPHDSVRLARQRIRTWNEMLRDAHLPANDEQDGPF